MSHHEKPEKSMVFLLNSSMIMLFVCMVVGGEWEESEKVNSSQAFYQLQGLMPGVQYHLRILPGNNSWEFETAGPGSLVTTIYGIFYLFHALTCCLFLRAA